MFRHIAYLIIYFVFCNIMFSIYRLLSVLFIIILLLLTFDRMDRLNYISLFNYSNVVINYDFLVGTIITFLFSELLIVEHIVDLFYFSFLLLVILLYTNNKISLLLTIILIYISWTGPIRMAYSSAMVILYLITYKNKFAILSLIFHPQSLLYLFFEYFNKIKLYYSILIIILLLITLNLNIDFFVNSINDVRAYRGEVIFEEAFPVISLSFVAYILSFTYMFLKNITSKVDWVMLLIIFFLFSFSNTEVFIYRFSQFQLIINLFKIHLMKVKLLNG